MIGEIERINQTMVKLVTRRSAEPLESLHV